MPAWSSVNEQDDQLDCPDDMVVTLLQVTYSNVSVSDDTNGITANIAGTFVSTNKSVKF